MTAKQKDAFTRDGRDETDADMRAMRDARRLLREHARDPHEPEIVAAATALVAARAAYGLCVAREVGE